MVGLSATWMKNVLNVMFMVRLNVTGPTALLFLGTKNVNMVTTTTVVVMMIPVERMKLVLAGLMRPLRMHLLCTWEARNILQLTVRLNRTFTRTTGRNETTGRVLRRPMNRPLTFRPNISAARLNVVLMSSRQFSVVPMGIYIEWNMTVSSISDSLIMKTLNGSRVVVSRVEMLTVMVAKFARVTPMLRLRR